MGRFFLLIALGFSWIFNAWGDSFEPIRGHVHLVRGLMIGIVSSQDTQKQVSLRQKTLEVSQKIDAALEALQTATLPVKENLSHFRTHWSEFKRTRDTEIFEALDRGDLETARDLIFGIQSQRFTEMCAILEKTNAHTIN